MGGCIVRPKSLSLTSDALQETLQPGEVSFYSFELSQQWLQKKVDLLIRCHVDRGSANNNRIESIYCARDRAFPKQKRKLWHTNRYCNCPHPTCDHCYPHCLNEHGGICTSCMGHDAHWERISHQLNMGGSSSDQGGGRGEGAASAALSKDGSAAPSSDALDPDDLSSLILLDDTLASNPDYIPDPPYAHQTGFEFALRLTTAGADGKYLTRPGRFMLTVEASEEVVSKKLRRQRRLEGEEEVHPVHYSIWIEEALPKADPRAGNEARVVETEEKIKEKQALLQKRREIRQKVVQGQEEKKAQAVEQQLLDEYGLPHDTDEDKKWRLKKQKQKPPGQEL